MGKRVIYTLCSPYPKWWSPCNKKNLYIAKSHGDGLRSSFYGDWGNGGITCFANTPVVAITRANGHVFNFSQQEEQK